MSVKMRVKFNNLDKIAAAIPSESKKIIEKGIHDIDAHATAMTPVDSGNLKNSKSILMQDQSGMILWSAEYAAYVNFGTYKMDAQPFASDAFDKVAPSIEAAFHQLEGKIT